MSTLRKEGSALLITVMIMAVLMASTMGAIAVRFDQLASTEKISNSSVAKIAADSGVARLKAKIKAGSAINSTGTTFSISDGAESDVTSLAAYNPSPRIPSAAYQPIATNLPRCLAVAVLAPWTNGDGYLFESYASNNPAMLFHYANIVNDTPLNRVGASGEGVISSLTKVGSFYNPFAPTGYTPDHPSYWTIRLGGPSDQFITRLGADGVSSFYRGLDFVYAPYLPRFNDAMITDYRFKFEQTIKINSFKIWIDASMTDDMLYQYGLGDLFVEDNNYRLSWFQPKLWNDTPELENNGVFVAKNASQDILTWEKRPPKVRVSSGTVQDMAVAIAHGTKLDMLGTYNGAAATITQGSALTLKYYGSLEGLRLNSKITVTALMSGSYTPVKLLNRTSDQGKFYNVTITNINTASGTVTVQFSINEIDTPKTTVDDTALSTSSVALFRLSSLPAHTTESSVSVKLDATGIETPSVPLEVAVDDRSCTLTCPAVGDIIQLRKGGVTPIWGKVVSISASGSSLTEVTIDKAREMPLLGKNYASAKIKHPKSGADVIAYYGGESIANEYAGGDYSEYRDLWFLNLSTLDWEYIAAGGTAPPRLAGAMVSPIVSGTANQMLLFGGMYHEYACGATDKVTCYYENTADKRVAKRINGNTYKLSLVSDNYQWEEVGATGASPTDGTYTMRLVSTLADRSGSEGWRLRAVSTNDVALPNDNSVAVSLSSAIGIAKDDQLAIRSGGNIAWALVESVNYTGNSISIKPYGLANNLPAQKLQIEVVNRKTNTALACSYNTDHCLASEVNQFAVGDQIVLERYGGGNSTLDAVFTGFVSSIDGGKYYFTQTEGGVAGAIALPVARYGGVMAPIATANTSVVLYQGAATNIAKYAYQPVVWEFNGINSAWSIRGTDTTQPNSANSNASNAYSKFITQSSATASPDDGKIVLENSALVSSLAANAEVVIEKAGANFRRVFHGYVDSSSLKANNNKATIIHNDNYSGDTLSIAGSVSVTIFNSARNDVELTANANVNAGEVILGQSDQTVGSGGIVYLKRGNSGYYVQATGRTYASNNYKITFSGPAIKGPLPTAYGTSAVSIISNSTQLNSISLHQNGSTVGGVEFTASLIPNINWVLRDSGESSINKRPAPRQGGAIASNASTLYLIAGGGKGEFTNGWTQDTGSNPYNWIFKQSQNSVSADLPNYFGGSLQFHGADLIFFGGSSKANAVESDYNRSIGAKINGQNDTSATSDGTYYAATINDPGSPAPQYSKDFTDTIKANSNNHASFSFGSGASMNICELLSHASAGCTGQQLRNLGVLGRGSSSDGGSSWGSVNYFNRVGALFQSGTAADGKRAFIMSGPVLNGASTNGAVEQDGYYPYTGGNVGGWTNTDKLPNINNVSNSKATMLAGVAKLGDSASSATILATSVGVGRAVVDNRGSYPLGVTGYCASSVTDDGDCATSRYALSWMPDPEDLLFTLNAAQVISSTDVYKVVGYYGGTMRAYLVTLRKGAEANIKEIVP